MFAWIQKLLSSERVDAEQESAAKRRARMQRETERLIDYKLRLARGSADAVGRMSAAAKARLRRRESKLDESAGRA